MKKRKANRLRFAKCFNDQAKNGYISKITIVTRMKVYNDVWKREREREREEKCFRKEVKKMCFIRKSIMNKHFIPFVSLQLIV